MMYDCLVIYVLIMHTCMHRESTSGKEGVDLLGTRPSRSILDYFFLFFRTCREYTDVTADVQRLAMVTEVWLSSSHDICLLLI